MASRKPKALTKATKAGELSPRLKQMAVNNVDYGELTHMIGETFANPISEWDLLRIKVPGSGVTSFRYPTIDGDKTVDSIEGVILGSMFRRSWWQTAYEDTGGGTPPDCSSDDCQRGYGVLPEEILKSMNWKAEDGAPGGKGFACSQCPYAKFGSDRRQRGQACKMTRPIFILPTNEVIPAVVVTPPGSLKSANEWFMALLRATTPMWSVVTKFSLEQVAGQPPYSRIKFVSAESGLRIPQDSDLARLIDQLREIVTSKLMPNFQVQPSDIGE